MFIQDVILVFLITLITTFGNSLGQSTYPLKDGQIITTTIAPGGRNYYYFTTSNPEQLFASNQSTIHLSLTVCRQPTQASHIENSNSTSRLQLYISDIHSLPDRNNAMVSTDSADGRAVWTSGNDTTEVWLAVDAPTLDTTRTGNWTYEIGVSTKDILHPIYFNKDQLDNNIPYLTLDDTDRNSALFLSSAFYTSQPNTTILMSQPPLDLTHSYCAAKSNEILHYQLNRTVTYRGTGRRPRQQFMITNLTQDTSYVAYLLTPTAEQTFGMTTPIQLSTKSNANCRIIYDLPFCDQVAYSVPINAETFLNDNIWSIAHQYDNQAKEKFKPFDVALSQYNCETTQYSLVRNCTDCHRDYKTWLCAVTIPRCTDPSPSEDTTQRMQTVPVAPALRSVPTNASRNSWIDETLMPGEWSELLPCIDLCYHVVQSCPPFLQFYCPTGDLATLQYGYWQNGTVSVNGTDLHYDINHPTCNRMGLNTSLLTISASSHTIQMNLSAILLTSCLTLLYTYLYSF